MSASKKKKKNKNKKKNYNKNNNGNINNFSNNTTDNSVINTDTSVDSSNNIETSLENNNEVTVSNNSIIEEFINANTAKSENTNEKDEVLKDNSADISSNDIQENSIINENVINENDTKSEQEKKDLTIEKQKKLVKNEKKLKKILTDVKKLIDSKRKKRTASIEKLSKTSMPTEKKDDKPDYAKEMLKNKKRRNYIITCSVILFVIILLLSTIFALLNVNNSNIVSGIKIDEIDASKLSLDECKNILNDVTEKKLMPEINLKYNDDYSIKLKPEEIEFKYDIEKAVSDAYEIGRDENIFKNNYSILFSALFGNKIKLDYSYNENLLNDYIENINSELPGVVIEPSYYIEDSNLIISKGKDGIEIDRDYLKKAIIDGITSRSIDEITNDGFSQTININVKNAKAKDIDVQKIHDEIYRLPQDAYFTTDPYQIFVDVDGIDYNVSIEEARNIINKEQKEEYTIPLKISKAEKTVQDLGKEAFPYTISTFSTKYDASNINRSTNLAIAANKINGRVLMPGELFSFNAVVGKRTIEEGYKDAKIYADGGVVDGLAGGICQISSTLYNAALLANLEIVERRNHSYPASYIQVGRDATVVYGVKDLQFKNSRSYPIKIEGSVKNGVAEFTIYGIEESEEYEIKILPVTTGTIPHGTEYIQDASLAPGQQVVAQSGHLGYRVTTYIEKRLNGELVSKEILSNDTYSPMQTKIRVGPAAPVAPAPVAPGVVGP